MALKIRRAQATDAAIIVEFTRSLASYEGSLQDVVATPADIALAMFACPPSAYCELAEWDGEPAGFAIWSYNFSIYLGKSCLWLEDLFVAEKFRRRGIGRALLFHLARKCRQEKLGRMEWSVLHGNEPATAFYHELGAKIEEGRSKCKWTAEDIADLARSHNFYIAD
jgi:diamine N-acetyltransferase